jgi:hypothetical protein
MQARDLGEIIVGFSAGLVCLLVLAASLIKAPETYWRHSSGVLVGILCLGLCGVGVDAAQAVVSFNGGPDNLAARILGPIEDGGEMLAMSVAVAAASLALHGASRRDRSNGTV